MLNNYQKYEISQTLSIDFEADEFKEMVSAIEEITKIKSSLLYNPQFEYEILRSVF
jgi:hypothetical protein